MKLGLSTLLCFRHGLELGADWAAAAQAPVAHLRSLNSKLGRQVFFNYIGFKNELSCTFSLVCVRAIDMLGTMKQQATNQEKLPGFPKHFRLQRLHLQCIAMHSKTIYMYRKLKPTKSLQVPC